MYLSPQCCITTKDARLCLFLPNDLCTRLGYLGRLHAMADSDSEDTNDEEDVLWAPSYMSLVEAFATEIKMESTINILFKS